MIGMLDTAARFLGYLILLSIATLVAFGVFAKWYFTNEVSAEAKQLAKETDPNNPIEQKTAEVVMDGLLDEVRTLNGNETIRAEPPPLTHFDWSVDEASQEDIEHILQTLQAAGYYTHPLPKVETHQDRGRWGRKRAGVWRHEPDWHIVEFHDDGSKERKERVEVPLPGEWEPAD